MTTQPYPIIVVCPGFHHPALTQSWVTVLQEYGSVPSDRWLISPTATIPPYAGGQIGQWLKQQRAIATTPQSPIHFVGFSAGVVGAIGAAHLWQQSGGRVGGLIAVDGWGVPLWGNFPIHRVSHDAFTDWSSGLLGAGGDRFYADPAVPHLELWRSPHTVQGWWLHPVLPGLALGAHRTYTTAAHFISAQLEAPTR